MITLGNLRRVVCVAGIALAVTPSFAQATVPLHDEAHINEQLRAAAIGDVIRKTCPTISARMVTVYFKARELEKYARAQGYTEDEVKAFLKDKDEKARVKAEAAAYLAEAGAIEGDPESYCRVGQAEIDADSLVGSLLNGN